MIRREIKEEIISALQKLTGHKYVEITPRGDAAIAAALSLVSKDKTVLIPEEGGWLSYPKIPAKLGLKVIEVKCDDAKINLQDLRNKLKEYSCGALLYQNPGGYFAEQPMKEIYSLCQTNNCLVIMDVSGSIGTKLCDGSYADVLVGSFGEWKLVEAKAGGFISCKDKALFEKVNKDIAVLTEIGSLKIILQKIRELPERILFLTQKRKKIIKDLKNFDLVHRNDLGFVVVVKYKNQTEKETNKMTSHFELSQKESLINYCKHNNLPWTECPRYIRLNKPAISIEVKRLIE
ncbi:MAG: aminotransferase class I/II-fold pyridoxal phosphate-dependent enzyme [Nanoarchaeota archaeon]|nr:aminotransferase class I/II-fold pyridoxal phosphate-dependent enzyme [Nanoarchaeota archaeon]